MFNGEVEKGEEAKDWVLGTKKYFQIYNYSDRLKSQLTITIESENRISSGKI